MCIPFRVGFSPVALLTLTSTRPVATIISLVATTRSLSHRLPTSRATNLNLFLADGHCKNSLGQMQIAFHINFPSLAPTTLTPATTGGHRNLATAYSLSDRLRTGGAANLHLTTTGGHLETLAAIVDFLSYTLPNGGSNNFNLRTTGGHCNLLSGHCAFPFISASHRWRPSLTSPRQATILISTAAMSHPFKYKIPNCGATNLNLATTGGHCKFPSIDCILTCISASHWWRHRP